MAAKTPTEQRKLAVRLSLDAKTLAVLDRQAGERGLSRSGFVRALLQEIDDEDELDRALVAEAEGALDDPAETFVPWTEARRKLGL